MTDKHSWSTNTTSIIRKAQKHLYYLRWLRRANWFIGLQLPTMEDIWRSCCPRRVATIITDPTQPSSHMFDLLPSGRRYRAICIRTSRFRNSFFPRAISYVNCEHQKRACFITVYLVRKCIWQPVQFMVGINNNVPYIKKCLSSFSFADIFYFKTVDTFSYVISSKNKMMSF